MTTSDSRATAGRGSGVGERPLRVVLVVEQLRRGVPGGIGRYITGLLQGLTSMVDGGEDVPELLLYASRPRSGHDALATFGLPVISSVLPGPVLTRAWDRGLIDAPGGGDVIHSLSLATPPARHAALVVTVHDLGWRQVPEAYPARGLKWHEAAFVRTRRRARRIVVPSEPVAQEVAAAGADASSIVVIPHGADHLPVPDRPSAATLLERLEVDGDFILSVGTLEPRKNLARLVEAYGRARLHLPAPWPLVVVGPAGWGDSPRFGPAAAATSGVVPAGPLDDGTLAALYERARLVAYVPLTEGFGFPPVEAMRHGTPVVSSSMPSLGGAGLVVDPESVVDITSGLVRVANDEVLRSQLVARGIARTKDLTWMASARAHVALWASLA